MKSPPNFDMDQYEARKKNFGSRLIRTPFLQISNSEVEGLVLGINPAPAKVKFDPSLMWSMRKNFSGRVLAELLHPTELLSG